MSKESRILHILDSSLDAVVTIDSDGKVVKTTVYRTYYRQADDQPEETWIEESAGGKMMQSSKSHTEFTGTFGNSQNVSSAMVSRRQE